MGTIGGSYEGFTAVMSTVHAHPALKAAVPFAPMIDGWMGDDWFHNGAFRQDGSIQYVYDQEATRRNDAEWWSDTRNTYDVYLRAGSAGALAKARGVDASSASGVSWPHIPPMTATGRSRHSTSSWRKTRRRYPC